MATLLTTEPMNESPRAPREIEVPASTAWPFVLAFGFALLFAGLVTSLSVSLLGAVLSVAGCIGWFCEVFPREHEEVVPVVAEDIRVTTERRIVELLPVGANVRAWLPVKTYPVSAGVKGGLAGSVAMAVLACAYGVLKAGSIWYPINLLAAAVYAESLKLGPGQLYSFHADSFAIALRSTHPCVCPCWFALRRDAAHVRAPPDRAGRVDRPCLMVGVPLHNVAPAQPIACQPHRLAMVHCFAGGLRNRGRFSRDARVADDDA